MKNYKITFEIYREAQNLHLRFKKWIGPIIVGIFAAYFFAIIKKPVDSYLSLGFLDLEIFFIFVALIMAGAIIYQNKVTYKKFYNSQKTFQDEITFTFDDEGAEWKAPSGNSKFKWSDFYQYKMNDKIIVLYLSMNMMYIIPISAFSNEMEKDKFIESLNGARLRGRRFA